MNKRKLYGIWHKYKKISLLVIVVGLIASSFTAVLALRQNNLNMLKLRQQVVEVDANGGDVNSALIELRNFVFSHMNTQLRTNDAGEPPIQLVASYNRYIADQQTKLTQSGKSDIYTNAQATCERSSPTLAERVNCIQLFVAENGGQVAEINYPPKDLYSFDFASPRWSPDLAGISLLLAIIFTVLLILRLAIGFIIKSYLG
jgi:hypothetical protein